MVTCINKSMGYKYSWGNSISSKKILNDVITLPCFDKIPYWNSMDILISAIQKLVIKDVVLHSDKKIKETKKVIDK